MRCIELSVYSRSTWNGVHSSNASAMSEPSAPCTSIEVSGPMKRSRPSAYERKRTPSSAMEMTIDLFRSRFRLISSATDPWPMEKT